MTESNNAGQDKKGGLAMNSHARPGKVKCDCCCAGTYCIITDALKPYCNGPFSDEHQLNTVTDNILSLYA